jgi:ferritin-like metal-binding protein YciE
MPETTARELKLIQYLNEAYGKEKQLETVLQAQIKLVKAAGRKPLEKRLTEHLRETRAQAKGLEKRIKALGGKAETSNIPGPDAAVGAATSLANKAIAAAKGPIQALRGTSPADNLLRNIRDAYWNEAEEIAHYHVIEAAADQLGDQETVKMAREFRRQEERVQSFLGKQIPQLVKEVIKTEVPKAERQPASASSSSRGSSSRSRGSSAGSRGGSSRSSSARSSASRSRSASSPGSSSGSTRSSGSSASKRPSGGSRARSSSSSSSSGGSSSS